MSTTDTYAGLLANHLMSALSFVTAVRWVARQDPTGVIHEAETWAGIDDASFGSLYIRYRDRRDHEYTASNKKLTSAPATEVRALLRLVFMHRCNNVDDIEAALWNQIVLAPFVAGAPAYKTQVLSSTKDKQFIYAEETGKEASRDTKWNLVSFDIDILYNRVATTEADCIPECDEC